MQWFGSKQCDVVFSFVVLFCQMFWLNIAFQVFCSFVIVYLCICVFCQMLNLPLNILCCLILMSLHFAGLIIHNIYDLSISSILSQFLHHRDIYLKTITTDYPQYMTFTAPSISRVSTISPWMGNLKFKFIWQIITLNRQS